MSPKYRSKSSYEKYFTNMARRINANIVCFSANLHWSTKFHGQLKNEEGFAGNTLPYTYPELAKCLGSSCRLLRHGKIFAPVHSLNRNSLLYWAQCPNGNQSVKNLLDIIYHASYQKPNIPCSGLHAKDVSYRTYCPFSTLLTWPRPSFLQPNVWHW
jgi:hypothetical protein